MESSARKQEAERKLRLYASQGLSLDLTRGKPSKAQLDLAEDLLTAVRTKEDCFPDGKTDLRNYGLTDGIPGMKKFFSRLTDIPEDQIVIGGNSSLQLMYDLMTDLMIFGSEGGGSPMIRSEKRKFLCPTPGYDRHFRITEKLGFEMIPIPMTESGPDLEAVAQAVADPDVKGIWCVPKYSNPDGITYSDETVRFLAKMDCAAKDFRIFWDLAYFVHDLYEPVPLLNILSEAEKCGKADRVYVFASTSKITYAGSGVSMVASGKKTASVISERLKTKTIGYDKINQLRHLKYLKDPENVRAIMERHAAILRPKFEAVLARFDKDLPGTGCTYSRPKGGYFISLYTPEGKASRIHRLASEAGLKLTPPGSAFPYGKDPKDHHLRIAPSAISPEELEGALDILVSAILAACL